MEAREEFLTRLHPNPWRINPSPQSVEMATAKNPVSRTAAIRIAELDRHNGLMPREPGYLICGVDIEEVSLAEAGKQYLYPGLPATVKRKPGIAAGEGIVSDAAWFFDPEGIHGIGHAERVKILAHRLASRAGGADIRTRALLWAALLHDVGRETDRREEYDHGSKSASWIRRCLGDLDRSLAREDIDFAARLAFWHEYTREQLEDLLGAESVPLEIKILMDADRLDRVRLDKSIRADRLILPASYPLISFAYSLFGNWHPASSRRKLRTARHFA